MKCFKIPRLITPFVKLRENLVDFYPLVNHQDSQVVKQIRDFKYRFLVVAILCGYDGFGALFPAFFKILSVPFSNR